MKHHHRSNILKKLIRYIILTINIVVSILLILAAISDQIPPSDALFFSYLGLLYPFIFTINILFIAYWLIAKRWFMLISLFSFLVCWEATQNHFPLHFGKKDNTDNTLKILTYNVMGFAYTDHTEARHNPIIDYIAQSDADIVCLQEYFVYNSGSRLTAQKVNNALQMYPYSSVIRLKNLEWGLAVYSKYPIIQSRPINYKSRDNGSSVHIININGKSLALINNHLESFKLTSRDKSKYSDFITEPGPENFGELRGTIRQKIGPAYILRAEQARRIANEISKLHCDYTIVCGDFNDTPTSYAYRTIRGRMHDAYTDAGSGPTGTYNQNHFHFRIDHILYSPNMKAIDCHVDKVKYSDHYPVRASIQMN
jgi:endonuclease/exonuclease/phosphatase family metal-dependent hydrolase